MQKKDDHQVPHHEATLRKRKNTHGATEAQVCEVYSRDYESATDMKKRYAKCAHAYEQAIGRRLQDEDYVFLMMMKTETLILRFLCQKKSTRSG